MKSLLAVIAGLTIGIGAASACLPPNPPTPAAPPTPPTPPQPDLSKDPTLYVVGYAHLDTQWRWAYPQTIREYIPETLNRNFELFDKYPGYIFNFSGSRRYEFMKEYYPAEYERLKSYVAAGRWFPCGSSVDENDANVPSGESQIRHVLYGNHYFRQEFGVASDEFMLPDCFGFPAALPQVLAHCGLTGFSTQKLTWNAAVPIPFKVGVWEGPDGSSIIAALDPGSYTGEVRENLATSNAWTQRIQANGKQSGVFTDYHYFGTGDTGGAPKEASVAMVQKSAETKGDISVIPSNADWMFKAITPEMRANLPKYKGELMLTQHSAGSISSQAYMKRWNRKNELLADAAERSAVAATWMGARDYPAKRLVDAWYLVLGSQMHDILPGTSLPVAYNYSWNDEVLAGNQFAAVLEDSAGAVISQMDTQTTGTPIVVYNPTSAQREDIVEAEIPSATPVGSVAVTGPDGKAVLAQVLAYDNGVARIAFLANVPPVGYATFGARLSADPQTTTATALRVTERELENSDYVVTLNNDGDVASIRDKKADRELLSAPARLGLFHENPGQWPAWNQDWEDRQLPAKAFVSGPATFKVIENGPARVAIEVTRETEGSVFVQHIRLAAGGAAARIEFDNDIQWKSRERSLRASFPLTVSNPTATYDIHAGVIERPNRQPHEYEYLFHQWFDLTDAKGDYGVSVMCDSKYASDKPDDNTLRLTLLYTPGTRGGYQDQGTQDIGRHKILYALYGHQGDWRQGQTPLQASRLNQPLLPFRATAHAGPLGKDFSLASVSDPNVMITAIKKAEDSSEVVVRLRQLSGSPTNGLRVAFAAPITAARELDGQEREIAPATIRNGELVTDVHGYGLKTFALTLGKAPATAPAIASTPISLPFDTDAVSNNSTRTDGGFTADASYPGEQFPRELVSDGVRFRFGPTADGQKNALACRGQEIKLPSGNFDRLYLIAAADADTSATLEVGGTQVPWNVQQWGGYVGQWDSRLWRGDVPEQAFNWTTDIAGLEPGYIKPDKVAWFCTHHHTPKGDAYYEYSYLFQYAIDIPKGVTSVQLPNNPAIKVFAASAATVGAPRAVAAAPLFDTLSNHTPDDARIVVGDGPFSDATDITIEPGFYWNAGTIRYTTDGSAPTASSPLYRGPITLNATTTVKVASIDPKGGAPRVASRTVTINDRTPPGIKGVVASANSSDMTVRFSEPLEASSIKPSAFAIEPAVGVQGAKLNDDRRSVTLTLAGQLEKDRSYKLTVSGASDASPARNALKGATADFVARGPIFSLDQVRPEQRGEPIRNIEGLPVKAGDSWTVNMFVRTDRQPANRTIIAGFGRCEQTAMGNARYVAKFAPGIHFWSHNQDVESTTAFDLKRWQMITATYDGKTLRMYKNGKKISEGNIKLIDDENVVNIAPKDPWDRRYQFNGDIRGFSIWATALNEDAINSLQDEMPKE